MGVTPVSLHLWPSNSPRATNYCLLRPVSTQLPKIRETFHKGGQVLHSNSPPKDTCVIARPDPARGSGGGALGGGAGGEAAGGDRAPGLGALPGAGVGGGG